MLLPSLTFNTRSAHHSTGTGQWSNLQLGDTHPHRHRAHHHCLQVGRADLLGSVRAMKCWACAGWFGAGSKRQVKGRYQAMLLMAADHTRRAIMRGLHQSARPAFVTSQHAARVVALALCSGAVARLIGLDPQECLRPEFALLFSGEAAHAALEAWGM